MKTIKLAAGCFVIGLLLTPTAGYSGDKNRHHSSAGESARDSVITTKIRAKMAADKHVSPMNINVDTDKDGVVVLSGNAKSQSEMNQAISISRSVNGVTKVINHIKL
jgi:hyperosmotically inducible protein